MGPRGVWGDGSLRGLGDGSLRGLGDGPPGVGGDGIRRGVARAPGGALAPPRGVWGDGSPQERGGLGGSSPRGGIWFWSVLPAGSTGTGGGRSTRPTCHSGAGWSTTRGSSPRSRTTGPSTGCRHGRPSLAGGNGSAPTS